MSWTPFNFDYIIVFPQSNCALLSFTNKSFLFDIIFLHLESSSDTYTFAWLVNDMAEI